ncbi:MAG: hypothetical protein ABH837_01920 [bacterium]
MYNLYMDQKQINKIINNKQYSIKETGISYRIINNWSKNGLINHLRSNKGSWHKLSFFELIEILIYEELRKNGFSLIKMKRVKKNILKNTFITLRPSNILINSLNLATINTVLGKNIYLVCNKDGENASFYSDTCLAEIIAGTSPLINEVYLDSSLLIITNLRKILKKLEIDYEKKPNKFGSLISTILDEENNQDIIINQEGIEKIRKIVSIKYRALEKNESINKLVNQPNQKTTLNSNEHGVQQTKIERELK